MCWSAPYGPVLHAHGCYASDYSPACQEKMQHLDCYTKLKALQHGREKETIHRWELCSMLWENPSAVCLMLCESGLPSIWSDARFTYYLYFSFYSILLKRLCYYAVFVGPFLLRSSSKSFTISLLCLPIAGVEHSHL